MLLTRRVTAVTGILLATLAVAAAAANPGSPAPPKAAVKIAVPIDTLPKYDTLKGVTATAYGTNGALAPSVAIMWVANPIGVINIVPTVRTAQKVNIAALKEGVVHLQASYYTASGQPVRDTLIFTVKKARVVSIGAYWGFNRDAAGNLLGYSDNVTIAPGQSRCIYVIDLDRTGGVVTGKSVTIVSQNPDVAFVDTSTSKACPDTSVNPYSLPATAFQPASTNLTHKAVRIALR